MEFRTANVLFKDKLAGAIEESASGGTRFIYGVAWREAIACCFPLSRREYEWPQGLHPFFQHLGPEGWLRERQARITNIEEQDDLGLLLRFGADCIGAVSVRPSANAPPEKEIKNDTVSLDRTVSGVQKKLLVIKDTQNAGFQPAGPTGPAPYIAKFNSENISTLVRNEALSLRWIAAVLGAREVNTFTLASVAVVNEVALVVTRFDRGANDTKLRLEDFAQILRMPRGPDFAGKYNAAYEDVAEAIKLHSARAMIDLTRFFRRLIAFTLIGNCDAHLKNFSLLETPSGMRLSPVYDVLNTMIYDQRFERTLALSINGEKVQLDAVTRPMLEAFGLRIGLTQQAVSQVFADLRRRAGKAASIIQPPEGEPPEGFVTRFAEIVSGACLRILAE